MFRKLSLLFLICCGSVAMAQVTITDTTINAGETVTLSADQDYVMDGFVFVEDGATLVIEAGTVIRALASPTTGDNASALVVARGGKIMANGTANAPIIFTSELDDVNDPNDLSAEDRGLWGGLILLGYATTNRGVEGQIEGIPTDETRATYGGNDDADNSGVLRYVSVRHGGAELGPGDEINGVTFGAVGSGTTIENVEVYANLDDGFEWFGGTVNTKYLVAAFCGDDGFDYDEGWRGKNQFWLAVQGTDSAGRVGEHDGGTVQETAEPFATPYILNATYIGPGVGNIPQGDGGEAIIFRDNAGGKYINGIITEYNGANNGNGVRVEDIDGSDSRERLENGDLLLSNNLWWGFAAGNTPEGIAPQDFVQTHLGDNNNQIVDPELTSVSRVNDGGLDPRPSIDGPAAAGAAAAPDAFFVSTPYYGAFDPAGALWTNNWTALSQNGHTPSTLLTIDDTFIEAGETVTLTADITYLMDGFVFVEDGATLIIEPGTVIKGLATPSNGDNASALIIARGGKIMANGTATNPIIFTSELDDVANPNDLSAEDRGLWGGLILLGYATTNRGVEGQIEGIPTDEVRATYGGNDDSDNSGVLRYVSVRHGGAELGPGDEINGVTFGAVGSATTVENVEVYANLDDGFEWFGGTVNTKYLVAAFCGDDGFDYDEGWRGKNQFWFAIQGTDSAGRIGEHDGGTVQETAAPFATPYILNATYIGPGVGNIPQGDGGEAIIFRDNAGGKYINGIITEYNGANSGNGVRVEDIDGADSRERLDAGDLLLSNNLWWGFGNGDTLEAIAPQDFVQTHLGENNNQIVDPQLNGVSRINDGLLDPRPSAVGPAASGASNVNDSFFMSVDFFGAFNPSNGLWTAGWTALSANGHTVASSVQTETRLVYSWVSNSNDFTSTLVVDNLSGVQASAELTARRADGSNETVVISVPAYGFTTLTAQTLFPNLGVGSGYTVTLVSDNPALQGRWTTSDRPNQSPSQGLAVDATGGNANVGKVINFGFLPGSDGFSSAPVLVNVSDLNVNVTIFYMDEVGNVVGTDELVAEPLQPVVPRFINDGEGNLTAVAYAETGYLTGVTFVFNAEGQTAIGNATSVDNFQPPQ